MEWQGTARRQATFTSPPFPKSQRSFVLEFFLLLLLFSLCSAILKPILQPVSLEVGESILRNSQQRVEGSGWSVGLAGA